MSVIWGVMQMNLTSSEFKRKFSVSMYKNLKISIGKMTFWKDFLEDVSGDLYPIIEKSEDCTEELKHNTYCVHKGYAKRLFCQFFPFATYELKTDITRGKAGFCFRLPVAEASVSVCDHQIIYTCEENTQTVSLPEFVMNDVSMIVSCRPGAFDIYFRYNEKPEYLCTFYEEKFKDSNDETLFSNGYVLLSASEGALVKEVLSYIDNGVSIADLRPIKYENGEVLLENGKIYFTASIRMQESSFHGVFSWVPTTAEFEFTGAVFYDCGDHKWRNYVAPVFLYHREKKQWYVWVSSFEHKHILAYSAFEGDPRFGVNVVDVTFMPSATENSKMSDFVGFAGDEDADFFYDEERKKWLMGLCRVNPLTMQYAYVFFESEHPFDGYRYIGKGTEGSETGGSFVKIDGELFFVCGNAYDKISDYRVYSKDGVKSALFNYPDGGFRGWGSVIPVRMGSRMRYFWLTFDRHNGSPYTWSYGNVYCFEAE